MSGWITERADAYCDSVRDGTHDSPKPVERGHRLITSKHIANETLNFAGANFISDEDYEAINQRSKVDVGDLLFSMIGTVGRVYRVDDEPDYAIKNMGLFKISDELKSKYLFYYMQSPTAKQYIEGCLAGSTQKFMSLTNLRAFPIVYPNDHTTMAAIVEILDSLTWKHRINQRTNDYLERCCQSLFDDIQNDRTNEVIQLSDVAAVNPKRHLTKGSLARCVEMANLSTSGSFPNDWCRKAYSGGMKFMNGDTILARITPCLENGKTAYINFLDEGEVAFGSTEYIVLASKGLLPAEFFYFLARNRAFVSYATNHMNGSSGRQRVSAQDIEAYRLRMPSSSQAARFADFARPIMEEILTRSLENRRLSSLRGALLPKLLSGEIDVSKVEIPTPPNNHLSV